ncbi:MAG: DUF4157 domain-containing protein [Calditrichaeota bacterium]|nr:MAG: DUF4157 domain-containing protein [Calditrichota bacterium]
MRDFTRQSRENSDSQTSSIRLHSHSQESQSSQRNNYQNHPDIRVQRFYAGLPPLQTKLQVGKSGDKYEQEADRVADKVVSGSDARTPLGNKISPIVQQSGNASEAEVDSSTQKAIRSSYGHGRKLPDDLRKQLEPKFGLAFGDILIHNDRNSHRLNRKLQSQAFTVGKNIYFGENKYKPDTQEGKRLLAHELTHTVQQTGAESIQKDPLPETETVTPETDNESLVNSELFGEEYSNEGELFTEDRNPKTLSEENELEEESPKPQFETKGGGTHTVTSSDTLKKISLETYGYARYWIDIKRANPGKVSKNGGFMLTGEVLTLPVIKVPKTSDGVSTLEEVQKGPIFSEEFTTTEQDVLRPLDFDKELNKDTPKPNLESGGDTKAGYPFVNIETELKDVMEYPVSFNPYFIATAKPILKAEVSLPQALNLGTVTNLKEYKYAVKQQVNEFLDLGLDLEFGNFLEGDFKPTLKFGTDINLGENFVTKFGGELAPPKLTVTGVAKDYLDLSKLTKNLQIIIKGEIGFQLSIIPNYEEIKDLLKSFVLDSVKAIERNLPIIIGAILGIAVGAGYKYIIGAISALLATTALGVVGTASTIILIGIIISKVFSWLKERDNG